MKRFVYIFFITFLAGLNLQAQNITRPNIHGPSGLEVNSFTGNLFYQRTDLYLPAPGIPIDLTFSYNSYRDTIDWGFGLGWTFSYNYRYYPDTTGSSDLIVERPDGRRDLYTFNGSGFDAPIGIFDTWTEIATGEYRLSTKYGMDYFFEDPSHQQITKITEPNGNELTFSYTGENLTGITHSSGRSVTLNWNGGHLFQVIDANVSPQRQWLYIYEDGKMRISVNPLFKPEEYIYNTNNLITNIIDRNQSPTYIVYDGGNRVKRLKSCDAELAITYAGSQGKTFVVEKGSAGEHITRYSFDADGNVMEKQGNCCGFNTTYAYDTDKNVSSLQDGNGNQTGYGYDSDGNVLAMADALGGTRNFTYEPAYNNLTQLTDKNGNTTSFSYDAEGNLTQIQRPLSITELYNYNPEGQVSQYTDGNSNSTNFTYNAFGDLTNINYPIGSEGFAYDGAGNLTTMTNPNGHTLNMNYDALDRLTDMTDPLGNQQNFEYDDEDNLTKVLDENGFGTDYVYDGLDRLIFVEDSAGMTGYVYDGVGNLTQMTDANGNISNFTYNGDNLLMEESDPEGNTTSYTYDSNRNLIQKTDPNGQTTTYSYDALNRLMARNYAGNNEAFGYDPEGNLISASNNGIQMIFTYDALNRLTSKTVVNWGKTISYTYDDAGNRASMTDPDGGVTNYTYDGNNRLTQIAAPGSGTTSFTYDFAGRLTQQTNGNSTYVNYFYDDADRVDSINHYDASGTLLLHYGYTYDARGNRLSMTDNNGTHTYSYDGSYRLDSVTYASGSTEYFMYDHTGNRTQLVKDGIGTQYSYDKADRLIAAGSANFTFDNNGNMTARTDSAGTTIYTYDGQDRLTVTTLSNGKSISYEYDPFGNRLSMTDTAGVVTRYFLDGANPLMEFTIGGQTQARYTSALSMDSWLSMTRSGQTYYYHQDALGSVKALTDGTQGVANSYNYDVFGEINAQTGSVKNPFTYTGRERDDQAGLYYYRTRYYNSGVGRFLTRDKELGLPDRPKTLNRYSYVENNPVINVDPKGEIIPLIVGVGIRLLASAAVRLSARAVVSTSVKGTLSGAAWSTATQFISKGCVDWTEVAVDAAFNFNPLGDFKRAAKLTSTFRTTVSRQILHSRSRLQVRGYKVGKLTKKEFDDLVDEFVTYRQKDLYEEIVSARLKREFREYVKTEAKGGIDCSREGFQQLIDGFSNSVGDINWNIDILAAYDPNEIIGPAGYDSSQWVSIKDTLNYTILFENDPDFATAPAQVVEVYLPLDGHVNPLTLRLKDFGFGDFNFTIPAGTGFYQKLLDDQALIDSLGVIVNMTAGLDFANNQAFWRFESLDPNTLLPPTDASLGFLPVNDSTIANGEGYVRFTIVPSPLAVTGDSITHQAEIIFDDNPAIITNTHFNIIDALPPTLTVSPIAAIVQDSFELAITFVDDSAASGTESYDLFLSIDGEPIITLALGIKQDTTVGFKGKQNKEHCVYALARDNVVNIQPYTTTPLTCFLVRDTAFIDFATPMGGEQFCLGDTVPISWTKKNVELISLEYSVDNGATYIPLVDSLAASDSVYLWAIPLNFMPSDSVLIQGYASLEDTIIGVVDSVFKIGNTLAPILTQADTAICIGDALTLGANQSYATYLWSTGETTPTITVNSAGAYSLQVVGLNGCTSPFSDTTNLTINALPPTPVIMASDSLTFCTGDSVILSGPSGFTYLWSTGETTQNIIVNSAGIFDLIVTDNNACVSPTSATVTTVVNPLPSQPMVTAGGPTTFCDGDSVTLSTPTGFSYLWNTGDISADLTVDSTGNYAVQVIDGNGCISPISSSTSVTVNALPAQPMITALSDTAFCQGDSVTLSGPAGFNYLWNTTDTTQTITTSIAGTYTLAVIDGNGCFSPISASVNTVVNPLPSQPTVTPLGSLIFCEGDSVSLSGPVGFTYLWSTGETSQNIFIDSVGNFTLIVFDSNSCASPVSLPITPTINPLPAQPLITANGPTTFCDGDSVTLSGPAGFTYLWSTGATTADITVDSAGSYTLQVIDGNSCFSPASISIDIVINPLPAQPLITTVGDTAFCEGDSVLLIGPSGFDYLWSSGATTQVISTDSVGTYTLTVSDGNGCVSPVSIPVNTSVNPLPLQPSITANGPLTFCLGDSVILTGPAGFTYLWSTGEITQSISADTAGIYTLAVIDSNSCISPLSTPIAVSVNALPTAPVISASGPTTFCEGDSVTLSGPSSFNYFWNTGDTTQSIVVDSSGSFDLIVVDGNSCSSLASIPTVVQVDTLPAQPTVDLANNGGICDGDTIMLSGPSGYTYQWNTGDVTQDILVDSAGFFSLTVFDGNGCESPASDSVTTFIQPLPVQPMVVANGPTDFCADDSVMLNGPVGFDYLWSTGDTTQSISVNQSGDYSLAVIDTNGCVSPLSIATQVMVQPLPPQPMILPADTVICEGDSLQLTASNADGYFWSTGDITQQIWVDSSTIVSVMVFDSVGCSSPISDQATVDVLAFPEQPTILLLNNDTLFADAQALYYQWYLGGVLLPDSTQSIVAQTSGMYTVIAYNGPCESTESEALSVILTGLGHQFLGSTIEIFPNPNEGRFTLRGSMLAAKRVRIQITDERGRLIDRFVAQTPGGELFENIDITEEAEGTYFIMLEARGKTSTFPVVILR